MFSTLCFKTPISLGRFQGFTNSGLEPCQVQQMYGSCTGRLSPCTWFIGCNVWLVLDEREAPIRGCAAPGQDNMKKSPICAASVTKYSSNCSQVGLNKFLAACKKETRRNLLRAGMCHNVSGMAISRAKSCKRLLFWFMNCLSRSREPRR